MLFILHNENKLKTLWNKEKIQFLIKADDVSGKNDI